MLDSFGMSVSSILPAFVRTWIRNGRSSKSSFRSRKGPTGAMISNSYLRLITESLPEHTYSPWIHMNIHWIPNNPTASPKQLVKCQQYSPLSHDNFEAPNYQLYHPRHENKQATYWDRPRFSDKVDRWLPVKMTKMTGWLNMGTTKSLQTSHLRLWSFCSSKQSFELKALNRIFFQSCTEESCVKCRVLYLGVRIIVHCCWNLPGILNGHSTVQLYITPRIM